VRLRRSDCSAPGIARVKRGRGFTYRDVQGRTVSDEQTLARIRELAIPPAWKDVWICADERGHLQAVGTDAAGRRQYRYHERWRERRDREKFERMLEFAEVLPKLRRRVARDLGGEDLGRERVLACAVRMLDVGFFRVGGETYAEENDSYGLATLRKSHATVRGDKVLFRYRAKSGQEQFHFITDAGVRDVLDQLKRRRGGGEELLAYREGRRWHDIQSSDINDYIKEIAAQVLAKEPDALSLPDDEMRETFRAIGVDLMFTHIKQSLHDFGTDFDVYTHEDSMHSSGRVEQAIAKLREAGSIYEKDGAVWLRTTDFGDDKDRVVIKSDGQPAYVAADIAYYLDKRQRGFDLCIYMLGADHHGYIARLKAVAASLGEDPATVEVLIGQMVNLVRDGQPVRMSKRAGTVITLDDLVEAIGVDAARYSLIRSSVDTPIDIDLALWSSASNENPVYYVQYAHARLAALARNAAELGLVPNTEHLELLTHEKEGALIRNLGEFQRVLKTAAALREPHRVSRYLEDLAGDYHRFYDSCRVLPQGDETPTDLHTARLALCQATRQVIANGLAILGVTAPERM